MILLRLAVLLGTFALSIGWAADPSPAIRNKLSAGDLASAESILEVHQLASGKDADYWTGLSWLARGAAMLGEEGKALAWAREIQRAADWAAPRWATPLGAAVEVESRVTAKRSKKAAVEYLRKQLDRAKGHAIEARVWKNYNVLTLVGQDAPPVPGVKFDRPTVLFFWAHWCGDCKAQAAALAKVAKKHPEVQWIAPTRTYAEHPGVEAEEAKERDAIAKAWAETYSGLGVKEPVIDRAAMIRYGVSSTPTFVTVDAKGKVRSYQTVRLTEDALESLMPAGRPGAEPPMKH